MSKKYIKYKCGRIELILAIKRAFDNLLENKTTDSIISSRGEHMMQFQYPNSGVLERGQIKINEKTVRVEASKEFFVLLKEEIGKIKEDKSEDRILEEHGGNFLQKNR